MLFFVVVLTCLTSCSSEKNNVAEAVSNTEVETISDKNISVKSIEAKSEQREEAVLFKSNETIAKEKIEKTKEVVAARKIETTKSKIEDAPKVVEKKSVNQKTELVFKIDPTDPLPLQYTSHKIADDYREKEWNPQKGKYYFSEMWEFNYKNETLRPDEFGYEGKFQLYLDAKSGTILVDNSQRNMISDEMVDFIIVHSDGRCFEGYTDIHGEKSLKKSGLGIRQALSQAKTIEATFHKNLRPIGEEKKYGKTKSLMLRGRGYEKSFLKTNDKSMVHLARLPMSALPLYIINKEKTEGKLPIAFNFVQMVPSNFWILEEHNEVKGKTISFKLENISTVTHFVNINDYR